ncbi:DUF4157 domain-containing protein, partial [Sporocytophaga myxococcoides]|uniref:eCIS core domain-containing protein n=1 Tax=Sporocytophaga myxococcoides TaxID=153721 RepID=UPI0009DBE7CE
QMMEAPEVEEEEVQMKKGPIQMMESGEQEEEELQMKKGPVQKMESPEVEEEEVQMKKDGGNANVASSPAEVSGSQMPHAVKAKMEAAFNADFSNVKIHEGDKAASMGAWAYAQGENIHFAPGKYNPNSTGGQELLGHELAHVVQQREGRVKGTMQAKGPTVNDDPALENEADELGFLAAHSLEAEEEEEEVEPSRPEYVVSTWGANILQEAAPHKPTGKQIPVGERLTLLSTGDKGIGKVKIQSTGEEVWTSMSKMTEVKLEIEDQLYRVSKEGTKIYPSPFSTKGTSVSLTQVQYLKIRESCGKFVRVEVSPTQWGWLKKEELLHKPKDTEDNFSSFTEITDWTTLDEVDEETFKKIEANRSAINDRTDTETYGKGGGNVLSKSGKGYMYTGKNLYDSPVTGSSEKDTDVKTSINTELKREGGYSSINTWDGQVFTYGRGFATGGSLVKLLKIILAKDPKYKNIFLQVGIGIKGNDIVVIGNDRKVTANDESKKAYAASQLIRSDARLQSFFIELGEKKEYGQDVADAQVQLLQTSGAFNYPSYVVDTENNTYKDNWNASSVRLMAHLKHWAPGGATWNTTDYSDTKGDLMQVIYKYITETAKKSVFVKATHSNNVIEWSASLLVLSKLKEFSEPQGIGYSTFISTYNDDYYKDLEIKNKKVYLKGENKVLSNAIILKDGSKYRIVVPMGAKLDAHLTEEK